MSKKIYLFSISSHKEATSINSLHIKLLKPQIDFSKYDYLIITSKQACEALKQYDKNDFLDKEALCISTATAKSYQDLGAKVLEIGSGYGDDLSAIINKYPKITRWLYLRAAVVASNFASSSRKNGYKVEEIVVYSSECSAEILNAKVTKSDTLIFTSPSSVKCFLKNISLSKENRVIVIGKSTAKALPEYITPYISKERTIESCIELAKNY